MPLAPPAKQEAWMHLALEQARLAPAHSDVPVGAIVVDTKGDVIGVGHNIRTRDADPTGHAEIVALRQAGQTSGSARLEGATLVVTLEPCVMCAGAIAQARISRLVFGAWDEKAGACGGGPHDLVRDRSLPHRVEEVIGGVLAGQCQELLTEFFGELRQNDSPV